MVVGTSTGATLATWLAHREATTAAERGEGLASAGETDLASARLTLDGELAALVLLSPNFALRDRRARVLTWPWGRQIARLVQGRYRSFEPTGSSQNFAEQSSRSTWTCGGSPASLL
jgi:hypothetical protein